MNALVYNDDHTSSRVSVSGRARAFIDYGRVHRRQARVQGQVVKERRDEKSQEKKVQKTYRPSPVLLYPYIFQLPLHVYPVMYECV